MLPGFRRPLDTLLSRSSHSDLGHLRITDFITVTSPKGSATLYRGHAFVRKGFNERLMKPVFEESDEVGPWTTWSALGRLSLVHHNCTNCTVRRSCDTHAACNDDCQLSRFSLQHAATREVVIYDYFNVVG